MTTPSASPEIPVRLGLQQRVLPTYRAPFLDALAGACPKGLGVFAGQPRSSENIECAKTLRLAQYTAARNRHLLQGSLYLCWQSNLLEWLKAWQPGALILEANPRYLRTPAAVRWMHQVQKAPVIGWGLGAPQISGALASLRQANRRRFLRQFDALITYSQAGAEQYHATGFPARRIFVARNAVAARPGQPAPQRPDNFSGGRANLLFVGRLQARKRVDLLLRACASLPEPIQPRLTIIGEGPAREDLEQLAAQVYPSAQFLGARHGLEAEPNFLAADLFILPGSGGLAVQQAMSYALPVIVAEGDGTQSDLVREENGWNLPPGDLSALTNTLRSALSDPSRLRRMGSASYRIVAEEINLETMVAAFIQAVNATL